MDDQMHGEGIWTFANGSKYTGGWVFGKSHRGEGQYMNGAGRRISLAPLAEEHHSSVPLE